MNRAFCELTGYDPSEAIGRNCRFLGGADTAPSVRAQLRQAVTSGRSTVTELLNYRKDGTPFRNAVMVAPVLSPDGTVAYYLGSQMLVAASDGFTVSARQERAMALVDRLTLRQRQVLEQMVQGFRNKQIASTLGIDEKTVKMHRAGMLARLGAATSADAIRVGVEAGL